MGRHRHRAGGLRLAGRSAAPEPRARRSRRGGAGHPGLAAAATCRAFDALNDWVFQTRESAEFLLQTEQMGRSFVEWLKLHHADAAERLR